MKRYYEGGSAAPSNGAPVPICKDDDDDGSGPDSDDYGEESSP